MSREIVRLLGDDRTIEAEASAIAQYLLLCERRDVDDVLRQLRKNGAASLLERLLDCESEFIGPTPRAIGIDLVSGISSDRIQKSLDVKHIQSSVVNARSDRIVPIIKPTILYSHPRYVWIRFHVSRDMLSREAMCSLNFGRLVELGDDIYELYVEKLRGLDVRRMVLDIMNDLEQHWRADLIFCSELSFFHDNVLLFLSNYVKFVWCNLTETKCFDPRTYEDVRLTVVYLTYGLLFIGGSNLSNMSEKTHPPLVAYTGERPKNAMSKFRSTKTYVVEGTRSMQTMDLPSDNGTKSNYIEVVSLISLDDACLRDIK